MSNKPYLTDIWKLETPLEDIAIETINAITRLALKGNTEAQFYLSDLWQERWDSIKSKLESEGSMWYVWYMDGVREYIRREYIDRPI